MICVKNSFTNLAGIIIGTVVPIIFTYVISIKVKESISRPRLTLCNKRNSIIYALSSIQKLYFMIKEGALINY